MNTLGGGLNINESPNSETADSSLRRVQVHPGLQMLRGRWGKEGLRGTSDVSGSLVVLRRGGTSGLESSEKGQTPEASGLGISGGNEDQSLSGQTGQLETNAGESLTEVDRLRQEVKDLSLLIEGLLKDNEELRSTVRDLFEELRRLRESQSSVLRDLLEELRRLRESQSSVQGSRQAVVELPSTLVPNTQPVVEGPSTTGEVEAPFSVGVTDGGSVAEGPSEGPVGEVLDAESAANNSNGGDVVELPSTVVPDTQPVVEGPSATGEVEAPSSVGVTDGESVAEGPSEGPVGGVLDAESAANNSNGGDVVELPSTVVPDTQPVAEGPSATGEVEAPSSVGVTDGGSVAEGLTVEGGIPSSHTEPVGQIEDPSKAARSAEGPETDDRIRYHESFILRSSVVEQTCGRLIGSHDLEDSLKRKLSELQARLKGRDWEHSVSSLFHQFDENNSNTMFLLAVYSIPAADLVGNITDLDLLAKFHDDVEKALNNVNRKISEGLTNTNDSEGSVLLRFAQKSFTDLANKINDRMIYLRSAVDHSQDVLPGSHGQAIPGEEVSVQEDLGEGVSGQGISDQGVAGEGVPDQEDLGEGIFDQKVSGEGISDQEVPGEEVSNQEDLGKGISDQEVSGEEVSNQEDLGKEISGEEVSDRGFSALQLRQAQEVVDRFLEETQLSAQYIPYMMLLGIVPGRGQSTPEVSTNPKGTTFEDDLKDLQQVLNGQQDPDYHASLKGLKRVNSEIMEPLKAVLASFLANIETIKQNDSYKKLANNISGLMNAISAMGLSSEQSDGSNSKLNIMEIYGILKEVAAVPDDELRGFISLFGSLGVDLRTIRDKIAALNAGYQKVQSLDNTSTAGELVHKVFVEFFQKYCQRLIDKGILYKEYPDVKSFESLLSKVKALKDQLEKVLQIGRSRAS